MTELLSWLHPIGGLVAACLVLWIGVQGIRSRHRRSYAVGARVRHGRLAKYVYAWVVAVWAAGVSTVAFVRSDLEPARSWHFWLMAGVVLLMTGGAVSSRLFPSQAAARGWHRQLGIAAMMLVMAGAALGLGLLPGCVYIPESAVLDRVKPGDTGGDTGGEDTADTAGVGPWYRDVDGDGSGDPAEVSDAAMRPEGYVGNAWDCVDSDPTEPVWVAPGTHPGVGTLADPMTSIQAAILVAEHCVRIRAGTYVENLTTGGKSIEIEGVDGAASTVVSGAGEASVFTELGTETVTLTGLTLTGGTGTLSSVTLPYYVGGGIEVDHSTLRLIDMVISGNSASSGGGMSCSDATVSMTNVQFVDNQADDAGGILQVRGTLTGDGVLLAGNTAKLYGGAAELREGTAELTNLTVNANGGQDGTDGVYAASMVSLALVDVTFLDHDTALEISAGTTAVTNAIFSAVKLIQITDPVAVSFRYSDTFGTSLEGVALGDGKGNLDADPMFTDFTGDGDWTNDDLTLLLGSPCLDAGDSTLMDEDGSVSDMGAAP